MEHIPTEDEFYISFSTKIEPGKIVAVRVRLDQVIIAELDVQMRVDLCDHPLYRDLQTYVEGNPI